MLRGRLVKGAQPKNWLRWSMIRYMILWSWQWFWDFAVVRVQSIFKGPIYGTGKSATGPTVISDLRSPVHRLFCQLSTQGHRLFSILFYKGLTDFFCMLNYGVIDYFHNFCCYSIVKLPVHEKRFISRDTGKPFFAKAYSAGPCKFFEVSVTGPPAFC